jgi:hypothetical protein
MIFFVPTFSLDEGEKDGKHKHNMTLRPKKINEHHHDYLRTRVCTIHRYVKIFSSSKEDTLTSRLNKLTFLAINPKIGYARISGKPYGFHLT